jgi:steroid 5-alpha reductase family enzyme
MVREFQGFQNKCYSPEILGDYIEEVEFNAVIAQAGRLAEKLYSQKRLSDNNGIEKYKYFLTFLSWCLIILFMVFLSLALLNGNREFEYSSYAIVIAAMTIFSVLTIYEACRDSKNNVFRFKDALRDHMIELCEL